MLRNSHVLLGATCPPRNIDAAFPQIFSNVTWLPSVDVSARVFLGKSTIRHNKARRGPRLAGMERDLQCIMENQMERKMEHEMETGFL